MAPDFVIIGAQKSASTFVHQCLAAHPEVYMPAREVTAFESPDYERGAVARLEAELARESARLHGIKRPNLLGTPGAAARLRRHAPDARLIAVLRNPVERAVSAYFHYMSDGFIPLRPLGEGMRALLDGAYDRRWPRAREILTFGRYHHGLEAYAHYFARGRVLVLLHEDVTRDAPAALRRVADFLGIAPEFEARRLAARPQAVVYHLGRLRLLRARNPLRFRYNPARTRLEQRRFNALGNGLAGAVTALDRLLLARLWPASRPALPADLRARLQALYAPDVRALEQLIGRDLGAWLAPAQAAPEPSALPIGGGGLSGARPGVGRP